MIAREAHYQSQHITFDTSHGYVVIEGSEMPSMRFVKTRELKVGDLIERFAYQDENGKTVRRLYLRITSINAVKGGVQIGFTNVDGTAETDELFSFTKFGWGKSWYVVNEEVAA